MEWSEIFLEDRVPSIEQIESYIKSPLWKQLHEKLLKQYDAKLKLEYSKCSMKKGWNIKYLVKGKNMCTIYPEAGFFSILVTVRETDLMQIEYMLPSFQKQLQEIYWNTNLYNKSKWLMIKVKNELILRDIIKIIDLKIT